MKGENLRAIRDRLAQNSVKARLQLAQIELELNLNSRGWRGKSSN